MGVITWSLMDLERKVNCLEVQKRLLMMTDEALLFCSSQTRSSGGYSTDRYLKYIPMVYYLTPLSVEKAILNYYTTENIELVQHIFKLQRN